MLTVFAEEQRIFESLCNGACGYLSSARRRPDCSRRCAKRTKAARRCRPTSRARWSTAFQQRPDPPEHALTPQEIRIVRMLAAGDSYKEVADQLGISVNTVRNYIRSIYEKLQVHTKSEAVSKALRGRLIN